jgi:hypothetical protein
VKECGVDIKQEERTQKTHKKDNKMKVYKGNVKVKHDIGRKKKKEKW